jgi:hypothetical protein
MYNQFSGLLGKVRGQIPLEFPWKLHPLFYITIYDGDKKNPIFPNNGSFPNNRIFPKNPGGKIQHMYWRLVRSF